jgi:DMSO/TMAO reductase YedYZ heme-binding membrane subunit
VSESAAIRPQPAARRPRTRQPIAAALAVGAVAGAGAVAVGLAAGGAGAEGWQLAARYTARVSFLLFLPVYLASPLRRLAPGPATRALVARRRALGLGFAAAHVVHLGALLRFARLSGEPPDLPALVVGGAAYAALLAMAATSNDAAVRRLGRSWRVLHRTGLHLLWFVFAFSYLGRLGREPVFFAPFAAAALGALALRVVAATRRRRQSAEVAAARAA